MERYIGLDVHAQSCTMVVLGPTGRRVLEQVIETHARTLVSAVLGVAGTRRLCFEEGAQSQWLFEVLNRHVDELVVVQPDAQRGTKSDASDAHRLAEMMRTRSWPKRVIKAPQRLSALRAAVRGYVTATQDRVRAKNRLRAVCRARGVNADEQIYDPANRATIINRLPVAARQLAQQFAARLDAANEARAAAETWLYAEAEKLPEVALVATAPGIGVVRSAQIVAVMMEPHRFRTKRQLWSYAGLAVVTHASAEWERNDAGWQRRTNKVLTRGLNRNRNPLLKSVFKSAAKTVVGTMKGHPLAEHYYKLTHAGTEPNLAILTIARRIAAAVHALWKAKETYDVARHTNKAA
jgi:transposase